MPAAARDRRWTALLCAAPASAMLVAAIGRAEGAEGLFHVGLAALAVMGAVGAFGTPTVRSALVRVPIAAVAAAIAFAVLGGGPGGACACGFLLLAVGLAAGGYAAWGRKLRTPRLAAGAIAAGILWVAMCGLFWADGVAEHVPLEERRPLRQAVLHLDPATALAYDAAHFDRLLDPVVYWDVQLASSTIEQPRALSTGTAWLVTGLLLLAGAGLVGRSAAPARS